MNATPTRSEHLQWCKARALVYLPDDPGQAVTSMLSDLGKHEETAKLAVDLFPLAMIAFGDAREARRYIEGFIE